MTTYEYTKIVIDVNPQGWNELQRLGSYGYKIIYSQSLPNKKVEHTLMKEKP